MTLTRPVRADIRRRALPPGRLAAADRADQAFSTFCGQYELPPGEDALLLHLTQLHERGMSSRAMQARLQNLDNAARLAGQQPWSQRRSVRRLLRGLHQLQPLGGRPRSLPLYAELVEALVDAIMTPSHDQRRWTAAVLLANDATASALSLHLLRWEHLRISREHTDITWPGPRPVRRHTRVDTPLVHFALRDLWANSAHHGGSVFASRFGHDGYNQVVWALRLLPPWDRVSMSREQLLPGPELEHAVAASASPSPQQLRDRALVLTAFHAALRGREAIALRDKSITATTQGLLIDVSGRRTQVGIRTAIGNYDAAGAWSAWLVAKHEQGLTDPDQRAFTQISGAKIWPAALSPAGLNNIVHAATELAALKATYPFTSLRSGWIRDAARGQLAPHEVAIAADLKSLTSVAIHERRENLLRDNVASRLGM